ncbi:hypothetical protein [Actinoplanes sp. URMC 104]|uniref:hypothetical protein n=1 Tax=Actinoplanes sp. URMC 104 TaxID=3423409 RepID=UPI003F1A2A6E
MAAAARAALTGDAATVRAFLRRGQHDVDPDVVRMAVTNSRVGMLTRDGNAYVDEGGLHAPGSFRRRTSSSSCWTAAGSASCRRPARRTSRRARSPRGLGCSSTPASTATVKRVGILRAGDVLQYRDGALTGAFPAGVAGIAEVATTGPRIATLLADGSGTVRSDLC